MADFEVPEDLSFNRGAIADPETFARDREAASWLFLCGDEFAAMDGGMSYAQVKAAVPESENIVSDPPRVLDVELARRHMAAIDRSAASMATARFMETWAHAHDVYDAAGERYQPTDRIRPVAHLGVRTRNYAYSVHQEQPPADEFRVELTAPSGEVWTWGPEDTAAQTKVQSVRGSAYDFCLLVTQRVNRADTDLVAAGADAEHWLDIAQAFAGPPGPGREATA